MSHEQYWLSGQWSFFVLRIYMYTCRNTATYSWHRLLTSGCVLEMRLGYLHKHYVASRPTGPIKLIPWTLCEKCLLSGRTENALHTTGGQFWWLSLPNMWEKETWPCLWLKYWGKRRKYSKPDCYHKSHQAINRSPQGHPVANNHHTKSVASSRSEEEMTVRRAQDQMRMSHKQRGWRGKSQH